MPDIEIIWNRIVAHAGEEFAQLRGRRFTYSVQGRALRPSTTNQILARSVFEQALKLVPLQNTKPVQHLRGPSYLYAILMDDRIRLTDW